MNSSENQMLSFEQETDNSNSNFLFTKNEFVKQYHILAQGKSANEKENANQYILHFQGSNEVWRVARELIIDSPSIEFQILGAQILSKKLKTHYSVLSLKQRSELRTFLFDILRQHCHNEAKTISNLAKKQITLSIAILGFTGIHSDWPNFVEDIITFMKLESSNDFFLLNGLEILENVANQESMEKLVSDMKIFQRIRSLFQSHFEQLSVIFNELLVHNSPQIGLQTLLCIESWAGSQFKYQLLTDEVLIRNLTLLLSNQDEDLFEKVARTILEGLKNSQNAEILETANVEQAMNLIRPCEVNSLKSLIDQLSFHTNDFIRSIPPNSQFCKFYSELIIELAQKFTILILEKSDYSKKLIKLMVLCTQHPNLYISQTTFEFWVSFQRTLKTYIPDILEPSSDWLIEPYFEVFLTVLEKSKLKKLSSLDSNGTQSKKNKNQKTMQLLKKYSLFSDCEDFSQSSFSSNDFSFSQLKLEDTLNQIESDGEEFEANKHHLDLDQVDADFTKTRVKDYRIYARDIFNTVFNVLSQFRGQFGVQPLLQILQSLMNKTQFLSQPNRDPNEALKQYYISAEVCLFVLQTMAENMLLEGQGGECFRQFIEFIVNNKEFPEHQKTVSMAMQLFYNAQTELIKNVNLFDATIKFILKYILDENLGLMASQTFSGIVKGVGSSSAIETFKYVAQFFVDNLEKISQQVVMDELVQGVFIFALNLQAQSHQLEAVSSLLLLIQQIINNTIIQLENNAQEQAQKQIIIMRAIGILQSLLNGLCNIENINQEVIKSVANFIGVNFKFLIISFETTTQSENAPKIITQFIEIFRQVTKILGQQENNLFFYQQCIDFLIASIRVSQRNPILNSSAMKIFKMVIDLTKMPSYSELFEAWLKQDFENYNTFFLNFMQGRIQVGSANNPFNLKNSEKNKDPDLITYFFDIQLHVIQNFTQFYLAHSCFSEVLSFSFESIQNISQYEMARSILNFYYPFIKHCSPIPEAQKITFMILDTTIDILPSVNSHLLHNISLLLMKFAEIYKNQTENLREFILNSFTTNAKYSQFNQQQKKILTDCIVQFSLDLKNLNLLKQLLSDFYQVHKEIFPPQEMFRNYEMKLKGLTHNSNRQEVKLPSFNENQGFISQQQSTLSSQPSNINHNACNLDDLFP